MPQVDVRLILRSNISTTHVLLLPFIDSVVEAFSRRPAAIAFLFLSVSALLPMLLTTSQYNLLARNDGSLYNVASALVGWAYSGVLKMAMIMMVMMRTMVARWRSSSNHVSALSIDVCVDTSRLVRRPIRVHSFYLSRFHLHLFTVCARSSSQTIKCCLLYTSDAADE